MLNRTWNRGVAPLAAALLAAPLFAHDDDPKILDVRPAYAGTGWTRSGGGTLAGTSFTSSGVTLLSWLSMADLDGANTGNDCWGYVSPVGREYAVIGTSNGTLFVEITDPFNPVVIESITGPTSLWRDVKVYLDHAYAVSEGGGGIQIMSMAGIDSGTVTLVGSVNGAGQSDTHNAAIDDVSGFLYRCGGQTTDGLRIYDLSDPANPVFLASWNDLYVHDVQVVTYTSGPFAGRQVAFACAGMNGGFSTPRLTILDVTDKQNIFVMDEVFYPNPAYSHQGWLSEDRQYFYLGDELDEDGVLTTTTFVIDVSDLNNATNAGSFTNGNQSIGHNLYTKGGLIFEANYTSGLRIFDANVNPTNPPEIAFFDTHPENDSDVYAGLWSVYPYFPSGVVIGSDENRGLFVLYPGDVSVTIALPNGAPASIDPVGDTVLVDITVDQSIVASLDLVYDAGAGPVTAPLVSVGGTLYEASFPATPCGTNVAWYISVETTAAGITVNLPELAPAETFNTVSALSLTVVLDDQMEIPSGWTTTSTASSGFWERVDPVGTSAQPEDDHTPSGSQCFVTGQHTGGGAGTNDIDGGSVTLISPTFDLSNLTEPAISYWRWYSNQQEDDALVVEVSDDGGGSWTNLETVGPTGPGTAGGWILSEFRVADFVTPSASVVVRFIASDTGQTSLVEAAIDDLQIADLECLVCESVNYCASNPNSTGSAGTIGTSGSTLISNNDFGLVASDLPPGVFGLFFYGPQASQVPFGDGFNCVAGGLLRLNPAQGADAFGQATRAVDLTNPPQPSGLITSGSTWNFQFWYRDLAAGLSGFNLTDGTAVTFCD